MRRKVKRQEMSIDLIMAIGLIWGHLRSRHFEEAYLLAKGCLRVWPDDRNLILMASYAAAEVLEPFDLGKLKAVEDSKSAEWVQLVMRRTVNPDGTRPPEALEALAAIAKPAPAPVAAKAPAKAPAAAKPAAVAKPTVPASAKPATPAAAKPAAPVAAKASAPAAARAPVPPKTPAPARTAGTINKNAQGSKT